MAKNAIFKMAATAILNFKNFNFGHVTAIGFNIWCSVPSFIKIGRFFTEIWRFNHFQIGGRPPSRILNIFSFCHVVLVDMPFCFLIQISLKSDNRSTSYSQKKRFSRWRPPPSSISKILVFFCHVTVIGFYIWCSVPSLIKIERYVTEIWRFNDFQNCGRPPSWILKICSFCYVGLVDMPFCFLLQNFAEIGQSVNELWPKKRFSRWRPPPSWISKIFVFFVAWLSLGSISDIKCFPYEKITLQCDHWTEEKRKRCFASI